MNHFHFNPVFAYFSVFFFFLYLICTFFSSVKVYDQRRLAKIDFLFSGNVIACQ